jgi:hypothetical protein
MLIGGWLLLKTGEQETPDERAINRERQPLNVSR